MTSVLTFSLILLTKIVLGDVVHQKCCGEREMLVKNPTYNCTKTTTTRKQIYAAKNDFIKNSDSVGECIDVYNDDFITLNISNEESFAFKDDIQQKCCPLGYIYNTITHSCIKSDKFPPNPFNYTLFKIGLKKCNIITDKIINDTIAEITLKSNKSNDSFCIDRNEKGSFTLRECQKYDVCDKISCFKKCCPDGQSYVNGAKCLDTFEYGMDLGGFGGIVEGYYEDFAIINNRACAKMYKIHKNANISLLKTGIFKENYKGHIRTVKLQDKTTYCIEHLTKKNTSGYFFFHCFPDHSGYSKFDSRKYPLILSCVFLIITIIVYVIIKEYKKMFGKILMNYCFTSFILFSVLLWSQLSHWATLTDSFECRIKSFSLIFLALAQFTWANVMSFEIWCTFGTTKLYLGTKHKEMELRKFFLYSLYSWGVPLILTLIIFLFYLWPVLPEAIQPYLAHNCFFEKKPGNYAYLLFLSTPLLIIQMINMVFFIKTVIYCVKVKNEINKINDGTRTHTMKKHQHDKERLFLIIKLSIVMGISFIFEVITGLFRMGDMGEFPKYTEIVLDVYNALQGVFIFIIFVCKRRVILGCLQKLKVFASQNKNPSASTRTQSSMTLNGVLLSSFGGKDKFSFNKNDN